MSIKMRCDGIKGESYDNLTLTRSIKLIPDKVTNSNGKSFVKCIRVTTWNPLLRDDELYARWDPNNGLVENGPNSLQMHCWEHDRIAKMCMKLFMLTCKKTKNYDKNV